MQSFIFFGFIVLVSLHNGCGITYGPHTKSLRDNQAATMEKYMDSSIEPCNDFYKYACGRWHKFHLLPENEIRVDQFDIMKNEISLVLKSLLNKKTNVSESNLDNADAVEKAKSFYSSCMNVDRIEQSGIQPLMEFLRTLGGWPAMEKNWTDKNVNWIDVLARARQLNERLIFDSYVYVDLRNPKDETYLLYVDEPYLSLGVPPGNRELYLTGSKELFAYKNLIVDILIELGVEKYSIPREVDDIVNFETALAKISSSPAERDAMSSRYTRMTIDDLSLNFPEIDWLRYFSDVHRKHLEKTEPIVVMAKRFAAELSDLIKNTNERTLVNYIIWKLVQKTSPHLGMNFRKIFHKFNIATTGVGISKDRNVCLHDTIKHFSMAAGSLYVRHNFVDVTKQNVGKLFAHLKKGFQRVLKQIDWLDSSTRILAEEKLDAMRIQVGFPKFILDAKQLNDFYQILHISKLNYFENMLSIYELDSIKETSKIGRKVNKNEWQIKPVNVDILYERQKQQLFITAAMLNSPIYHRHLPQFINYGGLGVLAAGEMSHGFDNKGAQFDVRGNLRTWWSSSSFEGFRSRRKCLQNQYQSVMGSNISKATLEEAVADNAALKVALYAYHEWVNKNLRKPVMLAEQLPGFNMTHEQMFFLNFAQLECHSTKPKTDSVFLERRTHSVSSYRVNGPLANSKHFATAFNCPVGSAMNPQKKCRIW